MKDKGNKFISITRLSSTSDYFHTNVIQNLKTRGQYMELMPLNAAALRKILLVRLHNEPF